MISLAIDIDKYKIPLEADCVNELKDHIINNNLYKCDCESTSFYWKNDKQVFECKLCKKRKSVKSFCEILQNSNLALNVWLSILHLYCLNKKKIEIQKIINHKKYSTVWDIEFRIKQFENKYFIQRKNHSTNDDTNILPLNNFSNIKEIVTVELLINQSEYINSKTYWHWFLKII